jgi:hypothetical protein
MSIVLIGSTSGSCTLQEQAVAGTTVLTLPTTSGTILTTGSSGQSIPKAALPTGSVLQVVNATGTNGASNSTTTFADTGLTGTITPTSATSKILVISYMGSFRVLGANNGIRMNLCRNGVEIYRTANEHLYLSRDLDVGTCSQYLDSPATTSAVTYKTQFALLTGAGGTAQSNPNDPVWSITMMEIAA